MVKKNVFRFNLPGLLHDGLEGFNLLSKKTPRNLMVCLKEMSARSRLLPNIPLVRFPVHAALLALLLCCFSPAYGQKIVYSDSTKNSFNEPISNAGIIDLSDCTHTVFSYIGGSIFTYDIAMSADSTVYAYIKAFTNMKLFGYTHFNGVFHANPLLLLHDPSITGLTCDENGKFYAAGSGISWTTSCCAYQEGYFGDLPPDLHCLGDITYRQGRFFMAAVGNKLVEVNMKDPSKSVVVMDFPPGTLPIHGLATVQLDCQTAVTYAIGRELTYSKIYEINFDDWTVSEVCQTNLSITGASSYTECSPPMCEIFIDLDSDNNSISFWGDYCTAFCLPPAVVADTDVVILSASGTLDSVTMQLTGILDAGLEYLTAVTSNNLVVTGDGTAWITLANGGSAGISDFEEALAAVQYRNDAVPVVTYGTRKVLVQGWAGGVSSPVSTSELMLDNNVLQLQQDLVGPTCHGLSDGSVLLGAKGGTGPYGFQWENGHAGAFADGLAAGMYPLIIIDSAGCYKPDTLVVGEPDSLVAVMAYDGAPALCDESGHLTANVGGGVQPYTYSWDDGADSSDRIGLGAGTYHLTVSDANGCTATAGYLIPAGDTVLVTEAASICQGETFVWSGNLLTADTLVCLVFPQPGGCDSTSCLQLTVHPLPALTLTADGSLCNGSPVTLSAGQHTTWLWQDASTGPGLTAAQPGVYSVTVTNAQGCTASASLTLSSGVEYNVAATGPTCAGDTDGRIAFVNTSGGISPLQYSIDGGQTFSASTVFENLAPGTYPLVVEDAAGCRTASEAQLKEPPVILLDAGEDLSIRLGESVTLSAQTNLANPLVLWQPPDHLDCPACLSTFARPVITTVYEVEITDPNGCKARDAVRVAVDRQLRVYVPTAFSPNGDGINDRLTVFSSAGVSSITSFRVFDRWGELVYEGKNLPPNDPQGGWDGTIRGKAAQPGTYIYLLRLQLADETEEWAEGEVVLVR